MGRLTEKDSRLGPLTYGRTSWRLWRVVWSSGGGEDAEGPPRNSLTVYAFGWVARLLLPTVLQPYRERRVATSWDAATIARMGRDWYEVANPREYGFSLHEGHLVLYLGRQTHDSSTTQDWSWFLPWTQWRHVRRSFYGVNGELFGTIANGAGWDAESAMADRCPTVAFAFDDYDGKRITATTRIEEREWRFGTGWFRWLSLFRRPKIQRSLDLRFSEEVGPEKGSWKGGTIGHSIAMQPNELHESAFRRYCAQEHRSKYRPFWVTFIERMAAVLAVMLLLVTTAAAQISPTSLTCGSTWNTDKKYLDLHGPSGATFAITLPPWLVCDRASGFTPARLACVCDKSATPTSAVLTSSATIGGTVYPITFLAKCSTSSGCGTGSPPLPPPTARPTSIATATPRPGATATPVRTGVPTPTRTPGDVRPTPPPQIGKRAPAGRSAYWQVSLLLNKITPVKWCYQMDANGVPLAPFTPTQVCMNQMVRTRMIALNEAMVAARDVPACDGARKKITGASMDSEMQTTLDPVYRRRFDSGRGVYVVDTKGPDYKKAQDGAELLRKCLTSDDGALACGQHPLLGGRTWDRFGARPDDLLLDFLTIHVEQGRCVVGAEVALPVPDERTYDKARLTLGHVELDGVQPALSAAQLAKLDECEHLHHLASEDQPLPAGRSVKQCHIELEDLARSDRELGFLSLLPFSGKVDPTIAATELRLIKRGEHRFYQQWAACLRRGDWECSDQKSVAHYGMHTMRNHKDARRLFRFPCSPNPMVDFFIRQCPIETWDQVIARLAREAQSQ